jgi:hypothetical protein
LNAQQESLESPRKQAVFAIPHETEKPRSQPLPETHDTAGAVSDPETLVRQAIAAYTLAGQDDEADRLRATLKPKFKAPTSLPTHLQRVK